MSSSLPRPLLHLVFHEAAQAYLRSLPLEHFMEATAQATQRKITLESFDLVHARWPDFQVFNELLVQYYVGRDQRVRQVVPDNMVVVHDKPIQAEGSFDVPLQPARPFLTLEYVSKSNRRKDYEDSFIKYEQELKVPYYLLFVPDAQELTLYKLKGRRYRSVPPNDAGRHAIPELDLEVGLVDGWVRYWYKGELLPLPADLLRDLERTREELREQRKRADAETQRADAETQRADAEKGRADAEKGRADAAEREMEQLRTQIEQLRARKKNGA